MRKIVEENMRLVDFAVKIGKSVSTKKTKRNKKKVSLTLRMKNSSKKNLTNTENDFGDEKTCLICGKK